MINESDSKNPILKLGRLELEFDIVRRFGIGLTVEVGIFSSSAAIALTLVAFCIVCHVVWDNPEEIYD